MKHRSVIAFVIVAAALFAAPQLSHDLRSLKSAFGSKLRGELMHAFLSLPATEVAPAAAPRPAETVLASCDKERAGAPAAKPRKDDSGASLSPRAEARTAAPDQLAMIVEPLSVSGSWSAALPAGALNGAGEMPRAGGGEVAMIIPPDSGIEPHALARASRAAAREGAKQARKAEEDVRATFVATDFDAKGATWIKQDEALRRLGESLPGTFEFRVGRDGSKTKLLKVRRCAGPSCPPPAPRAPRASGQDETAVPVSVVSAATALAGE
jgi:hypothetical protein